MLALAHPDNDRVKERAVHRRVAGVAGNGIAQRYEVNEPGDVEVGRLLGGGLPHRR